jgi:Binding-protein-dependent transport system inner membrane component
MVRQNPVYGNHPGAWSLPTRLTRRTGTRNSGRALQAGNQVRHDRRLDDLSAELERLHRVAVLPRREHEPRLVVTARVRFVDEDDRSSGNREPTAPSRTSGDLPLPPDRLPGTVLVQQWGSVVAALGIHHALVRGRSRESRAREFARSQRDRRNGVQSDRAILTILPLLERLSISLEEAAKDLGANTQETFRRVTLPLLTPALVSAFLIAFTLSFDDMRSRRSSRGASRPGPSTCSPSSACRAFCLNSSPCPPSCSSRRCCSSFRPRSAGASPNAGTGRNSLPGVSPSLPGTAGCQGPLSLDRYRGSAGRSSWWCRPGIPRG